MCVTSESISQDTIATVLNPNTTIRLSWSLIRKILNIITSIMDLIDIRSMIIGILKIISDIVIIIATAPANKKTKKKRSGVLVCGYHHHRGDLGMPKFRDCGHSGEKNSRGNCSERYEVNHGSWSQSQSNDNLLQYPWIRRTNWYRDQKSFYFISVDSSTWYFIRLGHVGGKSVNLVATASPSVLFQQDQLCEKYSLVTSRLHSKSCWVCLVSSVLGTRYQMHTYINTHVHTNIL